MSGLSKKLKYFFGWKEVVRTTNLKNLGWKMSKDDGEAASRYEAWKVNEARLELEDESDDEDGCVCVGCGWVFEGDEEPPYKDARDEAVCEDCVKCL